MKKIFSLLILTFLNLFSFANSISDTSLIKKHLTALTKSFGNRDYGNVATLNITADYIKSEFEKYADSTAVQMYDVQGQKSKYKNIICSFGIQNKKRIIVGAHYDVCEIQQGADDNATGVVGLLELARLLKGQKLNYRIDLVAYSLEEPPYFRTNEMGSYIHAKYLSDNKISVKGMICLEMIGYFKDEKHSQHYPLGLLKMFYGSKGNYITLVKKFGAGNFTRKFVRTYKRTNALKTKIFSGPKWLPGIDFSDHLNYWKFGYSAFMITDTSFYRNPNYHEKSDTVETLDISRMAKVIDGVFQSILNLK